MPAYTLRVSLFVCVALLLFSGLGTSCNTKHKGTLQDQYKIAGSSKLTVFIDSIAADQEEIDTTLYLELMTAKDTFLIKPVAQELSFPQLEDSLTQVNICYKDWYCPIQGDMLREEYPAMYFPGRNATISITTYPSKQLTTKKGWKQQTEGVHYKIRFKEEGRFFSAPLTRVRRRTE